MSGGVLKWRWPVNFSSGYWETLNCWWLNYISWFALMLLNFLLFYENEISEQTQLTLQMLSLEWDPGQSIHAHYDMALRYSVWFSSFLSLLLTVTLLSSNMLALLLLQKELSPCSCGRSHLLPPSGEPFTTRIQRKCLPPASFPPLIKQILMHYLIWPRDWFWLG